MAIVGVGVPLLAAALSGNLSIPHNDAWAYSRITATFGRTGVITLLGWNRASLIGQVVMLGPLGRWLVVQQVAVALLALVLLYCVYDLTRSTLGTGRAVCAAGMTALWPGFGSLATSFMSDVPALAGTFGALALGRSALRRDSRALFAAALAVGFWAGTVREQSLAAPAVVLAYGAFTRRTRTRVDAATLLGGALLFAVAFAGFELWHGGLANDDHAHLVLGLRKAVVALFRYSGQSYFTLAFAVAPVVVFMARPFRLSRGAWVATGVTALAAVGVIWRCHGPLLGNYLSGSGEYSSVLTGKSVVLGGDVVYLIDAIAVASGLLMAGILYERWRNIEPTLGLFTALTALATVLVAASGQAPYDRYLIALAPGVLAVLGSGAGGGPQPASKPDRTRAIVAGSSLGFLAIVSALLAANSFSFDSARWRAGTSIAKSGVPASRIDAGLEWTGWHSARGVIDRGHGHLPPYSWYSSIFSTERPCVVLHASPIAAKLRERAGWTSAGRYRYRTFLLVGSSTLYAYDTHAAGCGTSAPT